MIKKRITPMTIVMGAGELIAVINVENVIYRDDSIQALNPSSTPEISLSLRSETRSFRCKGLSTNVPFWQKGHMIFLLALLCHHFQLSLNSV